MECPYDKEPCSEVDTASMTLIKKCSECKRYNVWIRPTGATPILAEILKKLDELRGLVKKAL